MMTRHHDEFFPWGTGQEYTVYIMVNGRKSRKHCSSYFSILSQWLAWVGILSEAEGEGIENLDGITRSINTYYNSDKYLQFFFLLSLILQDEDARENQILVNAYLANHGHLGLLSTSRPRTINWTRCGNVLLERYRLTHRDHTPGPKLSRRRSKYISYCIHWARHYLQQAKIGRVPAARYLMRSRYRNVRFCLRAEASP